MKDDKRDKYPGEKVLNTIRARLSWAADQMPEPTALLGVSLVSGAAWGFAKAANLMVKGLSKEEAARMIQTFTWALIDSAQHYAEERGWNVSEFLNMCFGTHTPTSSTRLVGENNKNAEEVDSAKANTIMVQMLSELLATGEIEDVRMIKPGVFTWKIAKTPLGDKSGEENAAT